MGCVERVWVDLRGVPVFVPHGGLYYTMYSKQDCTNPACYRRTVVNMRARFGVFPYHAKSMVDTVDEGIVWQLDSDYNT